MRRWFWISSLLISEDEEGSARCHREGEEGEADADLLRQTARVAGAEDDVELEQELGPGLLNTDRD